MGRGSGPPARNGFASTHGAFLWVSGHKSSVLNRTKKVFLSFFGAANGGSLVGGRRGRQVGGVGGREGWGGEVVRTTSRGSRG